MSAARAEAALTAMAAPRSATESSGTVTLVPTASAALPFRSRTETERFVGLLVVVVGLILLVGCANLAGLMLARNEPRRGEAAIRVALGVSRLRLLHRGLADWSGAIIGRAAGDAGPLVPLLAQQVRAFDADLPISAASTLADRIAGLAMPQRMGASLLGVLGGLALALAILGVYASVSYAVTRRTREIGIRITLGATAPAIVGTVMSRTLLYAGVGTAAGVGAAFALTGLVEQFLFGVGPRDPVTFAVVTGTIVLAILLAGLAPALRAARIAPAVALAEE